MVPWTHLSIHFCPALKTDQLLSWLVHTLNKHSIDKVHT